MRNLIAGVTAAVTALAVGTLIAGAADSARVADATHQQQSAQAIAADTATDQGTADTAAYRAKLQEALNKLNAAYGDLAARDAAYRELLALSQGNVDKLQAANSQLQQQLQEAIARIQQASALGAQASSSGGHEREHEDDDDGD